MANKHYKTYVERLYEIGDSAYNEYNDMQLELKNMPKDSKMYIYTIQIGLKHHFIAEQCYNLADRIKDVFYE